MAREQKSIVVLKVGDPITDSLGYGDAVYCVEANATKYVTLANGLVPSTFAGLPDSSVTTSLLTKLSTDGSNGELPTTDPVVAGALWSNLGIVTVSAG